MPTHTHMDKLKGFVSRFQAVIMILIGLGFERNSDVPEPIQGDFKTVGAEISHAAGVVESGDQPSDELLDELDESLTKLEVDVADLKKEVPAGPPDEDDFN